jgi:RNA-directed DNA polymerase
MSGGDIRQQLYDRIRETSKDELILDEMIRLGYWQRGGGKPSLPEALIKRKGELDRELSELYRKQARWANPEAALKQMHKERKRAAMERRKETKLRQAAARHERALAWAGRRERDVLWLGEGVSAGLSGTAAGAKAVAGLPELGDAKALADAMGVSLAELRFLAYNRALTRVSHYQRFRIPKKTGGERLISAPMPRLKRAQYWILDNILARVPIHPAAQGFAPGRSILTNAAPHVGREVVINLDVKDFFPTVTWKRVKGKFRGLGYSEAVATVLALVCTEPDVDEIELDGQRLYAARGPRRLPQGAPTSPALTNLICWRLDKRLAGLAAKFGYTYTRYADDMTFSASGEAAAKASMLLKFIQEIVTAEGFTVHPDKTRVMRAHSRQEVTGLVVNERIGVPRDTLRRFRALLHQIEAKGPEGKRWGRGGNVLQAAAGFARFVHMVDAEKGAALVAQAEGLAARHGSGARRGKAAAAFRARAAKGEQPLERWWMAAGRPAPKPEPVLLEQQAAGEKAKQAAAAASAEPVQGAPAGGSVPKSGTAAAAPAPGARPAKSAGKRYPWSGLALGIAAYLVVRSAAEGWLPGVIVGVAALVPAAYGVYRWSRRRKGGR